MSGTRYLSPGRRVTVLDPTPGSPYFRLLYRDEFGRRRTTTGGRSLAGALKRAEERERRLGLHDPKAASATHVHHLLDDYVDPDRPKFEPRRGRSRFWSSGYRDKVNVWIAKVRPRIGHLRLGALTQQHLAVLINSQATYNQAHSLKVLLRGIVKFGCQQGYLAADQQNLAEVVITARSDVRPPRLAAALREGESDSLVTPDEVPSDQDVARLAQVDVGYDQWEGLVETLAYVGPRIHECIALDADSVRTKAVGGQAVETSVVISRQLVELRGGGRELRPPKNSRARIAPVPPVTPTGFELAKWLRARAEQARAEQAAGMNPRALLFPTLRSHTYWWLRNLRSRLFVPAATQAGWPSVTFPSSATYHVGHKTVTKRTRYRQWTYTLHSLRHRFATTARDEWHWEGQELCITGGWASEAFVLSRYYGRTAKVLQSAADKQRRAATLLSPDTSTDHTDGA